MNINLVFVVAYESEILSIYSYDNVGKLENSVLHELFKVYSIYRLGTLDQYKKIGLSINIDCEFDFPCDIRFHF